MKNVYVLRTFVEVGVLRLVAFQELRLFFVAKVQHQYFLTDLRHILAVFGRVVVTAWRAGHRPPAPSPGLDGIPAPLADGLPRKNTTRY